MNVNSEALGIIVAVATVIVTVIVFLISRRRKRGKVVALVGLCDSGKTLLLSRVSWSLISCFRGSIIRYADSEREIHQYLHQYN